MRRPVVLVIDVEPDGRTVLDRTNGWAGSLVSLEHLAGLRRALETATGTPVRFNWFLRTDPQIAGTWGRADWVAAACPGLIQTIAAHDDFRGIHVHAWRFNPDRGDWFSDFQDSAWIEECVVTSAEGFGAIFGEPPMGNRFGDRWMSADALGTIRRLGIRYDLTVEPGLPAAPVHDDPYATSGFPDFTNAPRQPYVPLGNDFRVASDSADASALWMLPVTTSAPSWRIVRRAPFLIRTSRPPNLALDHHVVWADIRAALDHVSPAPIVIVMRSGDLATPRFLANFTRTTAALARHPAMPDCDFVSADEAVARWRLRAP
jgi:hypothetical protein